MGSILRLSLVAVASVALLSGQDLSWKQKAIPDLKDAQQVLGESPWAKCVKLVRVRDLSKFERRDGGNMSAGIPPGYGFASVDWLKLVSIFDPRNSAMVKELARRLQPDLGSVQVRWESALPVREAERAAGAVDAPSFDGASYEVAVYEVAPPFRWNLSNQLRGLARIERDKKKHLRPVRVDVQYRDDGNVNLVYRFPRSAEIRNDRTLRFVAQIGRLYVSELFFRERWSSWGSRSFNSGFLLRPDPTAMFLAGACRA